VQTTADFGLPSNNYTFYERVWATCAVAPVRDKVFVLLRSRKVLYSALPCGGTAFVACSVRFVGVKYLCGV
jgi:hypothetical protein